MKNQLEIGDSIHAWDLLKYRVGVTLTIYSVTKTLAKTKSGQVFKREINYEVSKPESDKFEYVGEIDRKMPYGSRRFFVLK